MKSKNIPVDIKAKTIKEAQNEIKIILEKLENSETQLENSLDLYNRMIQLNNYVHEEFKKKANEIKQSISKKNTKK